MTRQDAIADAKTLVPNVGQAAYVIRRNCRSSDYRAVTERALPQWEHSCGYEVVVEVQNEGDDFGITVATVDDGWYF